MTMKLNRSFAEAEAEQTLLVGARLDARMVGDTKIDDLGVRFPNVDIDTERLEQEAEPLVDKQDYVVRRPSETVMLLWSGGLDSTAVLSNCLKQGLDVQPIYLASRHGPYLMRELYSQTKLWHAIKDMDFPGYLYPSMFKDMLPIMDAYRLSADLVPNRNELFVQYACHVMAQLGINKLGTGEYTGAEHWVVGWHVPVEDCEISSFEGWMKTHLPKRLHEGSKLYTLDDFGPAHVKARRLKIGVNAIGVEGMTHTTCCLSDTIMECGACYCCVERAAAFHMLGAEDKTRYLVDPKTSWLWPYYMEQMAAFPA